MTLVRQVFGLVLVASAATIALDSFGFVAMLVTIAAFVTFGLGDLLEADNGDGF